MIFFVDCQREKRKNIEKLIFISDFCECKIFQYCILLWFNSFSYFPSPWNITKVLKKMLFQTRIEQVVMALSVNGLNITMVSFAFFLHPDELYMCVLFYILHVHMLLYLLHICAVLSILRTCFVLSIVRSAYVFLYIYVMFYVLFYLLHALF